MNEHDANERDVESLALDDVLEADKWARDRATSLAEKGGN